MSYSLVNPLPHFLIGDICIARGTIHEVVIEKINCNTGQIDDDHQWSYSCHVPTGIGLKTAWWNANELTLKTKIVPHYSMKYQTRRSSMAVTTSVPVASIGYKIGTILEGNNKAKGNLWIITKDNSLEGSLLWDGQAKVAAPYLDYKRDMMRLSMTVVGFSTAIQWMYGNMPTWATVLIGAGMNSIASLVTQLPFNPAAMPAVHKAMAAITTQKRLQDLGLTKPGYAPALEASCPSRKEGSHEYIAYYGFTENYSYCAYCDHKRDIPK